VSFQLIHLACEAVPRTSAAIHARIVAADFMALLLEQREQRLTEEGQRQAEQARAVLRGRISGGGLEHRP
jgi:hypothetical protein